MTIQEQLREHGEGVYEAGVERLVLAAADRIDALEAALRDIVATSPGAPPSMQRIAREALETS